MLRALVASCRGFPDRSIRHAARPAFTSELQRHHFHHLRLDPPFRLPTMSLTYGTGGATAALGVVALCT
jgi:hypothetical protein